MSLIVGLKDELEIRVLRRVSLNFGKFLCGEKNVRRNYVSKFVMKENKKKYAISKRMVFFL